MAVKAFQLPLVVLLSVVLGAGLRLWLHGSAAERPDGEPLQAKPSPAESAHVKVAPATVAVFVAREAIPRGTHLLAPEKLFEVRHYRKDDVPADAVLDLAVLRGRFLWQSLAKWEAVKSENVSEYCPPPPGTRAFGFVYTTNVPPSQIVPGMRVDITYAWPPAEGNRKTSKTVKNVLIVANDRASKQSVPSPPINTLTVAASPEVIVEICLARELGPIHVVPMVEVLVAKRFLEQSTRFDTPEKLVEIRRYRKGEEPRDAISDMAALRGMYLKCSIAKGDPIRDWEVTIPFGKPAAGWRAMGIAFTTYPGAERIVGGERVDIFTRVSAGGQEKEQLVLKGVLVLDGSCARPVPGTTTITVGAPLEDVLRIQIAMDRGPLRVVLHSAKDTTK